MSASTVAMFQILALAILLRWVLSLALLVLLASYATAHEPAGALQGAAPLMLGGADDYWFGWCCWAYGNTDC